MSDEQTKTSAQHIQGQTEIPATFTPVVGDDHIRREVMIPMRDGVKLFTLIMIPKGAARAPMMLDRTPYGATKNSRVSASLRAAMTLHAFHADLIQAGYIVVLQDIRGKFKSEGEYMMNRPLCGPLNPSTTDHATDAWDTIQWLTDNVPESNSRVGTIGISYDGFTTLMSLVNPHPALKAAVPINPMVDNWIGDDWFHNGAFRQGATLQYVYVQTTGKSSELPWPLLRQDEYETWMSAGSASELAGQLGMADLPFWQSITRHPDYDSFWSEQAVDKVLARQPLTVPTLHVHSQWDAEDSYGSMATYAAMEPKDSTNDKNYLVIGPWSHTTVGFGEGASLGPIKFGSDTARWFRSHLMLPFLDQHLKDDAKPANLSPVTAFESGTNIWRKYESWPQSGPGTAHPTQSIYLAPGNCLTFAKPTSKPNDFDEFVSDPAKPVTYQPRPIRPKAPGSGWDQWLVDDQRFAGDRPDVLVYVSDVLNKPLRLAGQPVAHLFASTTGTDADWIVKLIDVYPDEVPGDPAMGCYHLPIAMEILRGRYRDDPAKPSPIPAGEIIPYTIRLPHISHTVLPGHRLMVQIQCSWFPLYDRNPQSFVDNIFFAKASDYRKATQRVFRTAPHASHIELPVIP